MLRSILLPLFLVACIGSSKDTVTGQHTGDVTNGITIPYAQLDDCETCLEGGMAWQEQGCFDDCTYQDVSCWTSQCPSACQASDCGNCFTQADCETVQCAWDPQPYSNACK